MFMYNIKSEHMRLILLVVVVVEVVLVVVIAGILIVGVVDVEHTAIPKYKPFVSCATPRMRLTKNQKKKEGKKRDRNCL